MRPHDAVIPPTVTALCDRCGREYRTADARLSLCPGCNIAAQLTAPNSATVARALSHRCEVCKAVPGQRCRNTIKPGEVLPGRVVHLARIEAS